MFKITQGGKTLVGNNEDYWNPNTRVWFEQSEGEKMGAMYVGFDDLYPQGGMNEARDTPIFSLAVKLLAVDVGCPSLHK